MLVTEKRPRNLDWKHAGALLFGDWGTSRLYVLGLAFFYAGHLSPAYLAAIGVLMAAVAWAYTIVCRSFPDGGGVYASGRMLSPTLGVIGATLLLCDYIVTAALSTFEGLHYFGAPDSLNLPLSIAIIALLGLVNWFGARSAGRFALIIALGALLTSALIAVAVIRFVPAGITTMSHAPAGHGAVDHWTTLVRIVLALSGVEAVANMTGVMREPVARTARKTIWPVLFEVALLNLVFGVALAGLPELATVATPHAEIYTTPGSAPPEVREYRDTAMKLLALEGATALIGPAVGAAFATIAGIVFGLLLVSAANTAIVGMIGVQYAMARDGELPRAATRLNYSGVPVAPLLIACIAPVLVLLFARDLTMLAELYAVGVVGAITIDLGCLTLNRRLAIRTWERVGLGTIGVVMLGVEATILVTKPAATAFAGSVVAAALISRFIARRRRAATAAALEPAHGWLAELQQSIPPIDPSKPKVMLAARGKNQADFAVDLARRRGATLFAIFVRTLRVMDTGPGKAARIEDDRDALETLGYTVMTARALGVHCIPIYVTSPDIAEEILDYTVTYGCDTLIMGKTQRKALSRAVAGDVVAKVARHLPDGVALITRAPDPHPLAIPDARSDTSAGA